MEHPLVRPSLAPYGFTHWRTRLDYKDPLSPAYVNPERYITKFWAKIHRLDAVRPLPIQTIVHEILPGMATANRLTKGDFTFDDLPYLSSDIVLLSSIVQWFGTNVGSCFLETNILLKPCPHPEREFVMKFEQEMERRDMVAFWGHECDDVCKDLQGPGRIFLTLLHDDHHYDSSTVTPRDRMVATGLMRWLGTNAGRKFIAAWLARKKHREEISRQQQHAARVAQRQTA